MAAPFARAAEVAPNRRTSTLSHNMVNSVCRV
jgi:hypothetical protein